MYIIHTLNDEEMREYHREIKTNHLAQIKFIEY